MADESITRIKLVYQGGLASEGHLHLYEFSRAANGYSRMLQTIEYYRREGKIAKRIKGGANTDIIVSSPEKGSFVFEAAVIVSGHVLPVLAGIPFDVIVSFVVDLLKFKKSSDADTIIELAKIRLEEEKIRSVRDVEMEREKTEQMKTLERVAVSGNATALEALSLTRWALESNNTAIARAGINQEELLNAANDIESDMYRSAQLSRYEGQLRQIPTDEMAQLASRVRPMLTEVGLPLRKSADVVAIYSEAASEPMVRFDEEQIKALGDRTVDEDESSFEASLKSYDRENGSGKFRDRQIGSIHAFIIPANNRRQMQGKIAEAMQRNLSVFVGNVVRDQGGNMTSLILNDIFAADGTPNS